MRRAVVVEDDRDIRELITLTLSDLGLEVTAVDPGLAGVEAVRELRPDLDASVREVIGLLRKSDPRALPSHHRETLMDFFRDAIRLHLDRLGAREAASLFAQPEAELAQEAP